MFLDRQLASDNVEQSIPANKVKSYQALSLENGKPITVANATGESNRIEFMGYMVCSLQRRDARSGTVV